MVEAVVFDMDGVIVESEQRWEAARRRLVLDSGRDYPVQATRRMQGMSAREWEAYLHDELGVPGSPAEIGRQVVAEIAASYRSDLPLIDGAVDAVRALAARYRLAIASSANREVIELALSLAGLTDAFAAVVSSEEVERGKPEPDVYFEAAKRLGVAATSCVAVEDSSNGLRSAHAAGMGVVAVPNRAYPPAADALALADVVLDSIERLTPDVVAAAHPHLSPTEQGARMASITLPEPVASFVDAVNRHDDGAFLDAFTVGGAVDDWGRTFTGRDEIKAWSDKEFIGSRPTLTVEEFFEDGDELVVVGDWRSNHANGRSRFAFLVNGDRVAKVTIREG